MTDKALGYLGIMRKAGKLAIGEIDSGSAVRGGKAILLCLAADASDNARTRAEGFVYQTNTPLIRLPFEKLLREHEDMRLVRLNRSKAAVPASLADRAVGVDGDMAGSITPSAGMRAAFSSESMSM
mgnify:CR=1 FL=1